MASHQISILGPDGRPLRRRSPSGPAGLRGRYDAAITNAESERHWANADGLSAAAANSPEVRRVLRNRARYEAANNSYCSGMVETLANDAIGSGPRLQLATGDPALDDPINAEFEEWTAAVGLAEKLRTFREARAVDGEAFAVVFRNPAVDAAVTLDLRLVEADQVATPDLYYAPPREAIDGIRFDEYGNPSEYHVLRDHPGDVYLEALAGEYDRYPAARVLHWFKRRRPGQWRGVPEIAAALPLFGQLRRYTLATLSAAEIAALFAVLLKSIMPPDDGDEGIAAFDMKEVVRGMMTALPDGYDATQLKAEQPTTTYPAFKHEIVGEVARSLNMPFNVAAGNSSSYNYASGRLDHQVYHRAIGVDRYHLETAILDRVLGWWLNAWLIANGRGDLLGDPTRPASLRRWPHEWYWDGFAHVDPVKEATAQEARLRSGTATLADEWAEAGHDWRAKARQQAEERAYYAELGIPYPGDAAGTNPQRNPGGSGDADDSETAE